MRIRWTVRRLPDGRWEGEVEVPTGAGESQAFRVRDRSPGEAIEGAVLGAEEWCGVADELGFVDLGNLIPGLLNTAGTIVSSIASRGKGGASPLPPGAASLPGPFASLASTAAMRPGGFPYPGGPPSGWAPPYAGPMPAMPGYPAAPPWGGYKPF